MGLAGNSIGVSQNLQLHVRLKDPAAEGRKTKWQVSGFQQGLAGPLQGDLGVGASWAGWEGAQGQVMPSQAAWSWQVAGWATKPQE